ncbi:MAG: transketolase family protein [Clostridia bacterium]|nr:transketolase family protein [Clostridia bacterium]
MGVLVDKFYVDGTEMRQAYCAALTEEAAVNDRITVVDADVSHSVGTEPFYKKFPARSINCGIMEAHAIGLCAGMSAVGLVPFFHAFGVFATRRVFDQIFISCAYQNLNVKIIGADPGVTAATNGGTHMPFEDMGLMRLIPNAVIVEPADSTMYKTAVKFMAEKYGLFYLRTSRRKTVRIYSDAAKFEIGKANKLADGTDVCIFACGIMVYEALKARELLAAKGVSAAVYDMHTVKPIDAEAVIYEAEKCGALVVAENHNVIGGLGSAVCEVVSENFPVPVERVGVKESFGEVGSQEYLQTRFGLTAEKIAEKAVKSIERKKQRK